jgi:selenide, water dikinase
LSHLPARLNNPDVLVGLETGDDAAVYRLRSDLALVVTTDFFTPIVDDAYTFGAIAAANALSDIYAMAAEPLMAVNLVAFPIKELPGRILAEILRGGADKVREAGIEILGGHSIDDHEPKYGLAVIGTVHPEKVVRNRGGRAGDRLVLTKPLGTGIISTALKHGVAPADAERAAVDSMLRLNREAAMVMRGMDVHAATDVTGFGLLGHLHELALGSGVSAEVRASAVPAIDGVLDALASAEPPIAGGTRRNRDWVEPNVDWDGDVPEQLRWLLCDAMTSGGLLVAAPEGSDLPGAEIGRVVDGEPGRIRVTA